MPLPKHLRGKRTDPDITSAMMGSIARQSQEYAALVSLWRAYCSLQLVSFGDVTYLDVRREYELALIALLTACKQNRKLK